MRDFNKRFNLSCDDEQWALRFLNQSRMERILRLADSAFSEFAVTLCGDGRLYIAAHSGHSFSMLKQGVVRHRTPCGSALPVN